MQIMNESNVVEIPFLITLIGSIRLLAMILLPYASAKGDYKEYLKNAPNDYYVSEICYPPDAYRNIASGNIRNVSASDISYCLKEFTFYGFIKLYE